MRLRLTRGADNDLEGAIDTSYDLFGPAQALSYGDLIDRAIQLAVSDPERPGSRTRPDLGQNVRSFHVGQAAPRRGAASHVIFYAVGRTADGEEELIVLRVLHEAMEPGRRVAAALADEHSLTRSSLPRPPRSPGRS